MLEVTLLNLLLVRIEGRCVSQIHRPMVLSTKGWVVRIPLIATVEPTSRLASHLKAVIVGITKTTNLDSGSGARTSCMRWVAAKHRHSRPELGSTKGDHMFPINPGICQRLYELYNKGGFYRI